LGKEREGQKEGTRAGGVSVALEGQPKGETSANSDGERGPAKQKAMQRGGARGGK